MNKRFQNKRESKVGNDDSDLLFQISNICPKMLSIDDILDKVDGIMEEICSTSSLDDKLLFLKYFESFVITEYEKITSHLVESGQFLSLSNYFYNDKIDEMNEVMTSILSHIFLIQDKLILNSILDPTYNIINYLTDGLDCYRSGTIAQNTVHALNNMGGNEDYLHELFNINYLDYIYKYIHKTELKVKELRLGTWSISILACFTLTDKELKIILELIEMVIISRVNDQPTIDSCLKTLLNLCRLNDITIIRNNDKIINFITQHAQLESAPQCNISIAIINYILGENSDYTDVDNLITSELFQNLIEIFREYLDKKYVLMETPKENEEGLNTDITMNTILCILYYFSMRAKFATELINNKFVDGLVNFVVSNTLSHKFIYDISYLIQSGFENCEGKDEL